MKLITPNEEYECDVAIIDGDTVFLIGENNMTFGGVSNISDYSVSEAETIWTFQDRSAYFSEKANSRDIVKEAKYMLYKSDFVASKIAEGAATREEYADIIAQRQAWRDEINQLEN